MLPSHKQIYLFQSFLHNRPFHPSASIVPFGFCTSPDPPCPFSTSFTSTISPLLCPLELGVASSWIPARLLLRSIDSVFSCQNSFKPNFVGLFGFKTITGVSPGLLQPLAHN